LGFTTSTCVFLASSLPPSTTTITTYLRENERPGHPPARHYRFITHHHHIIAIIIITDIIITFVFDYSSNTTYSRKNPVNGLIRFTDTRALYLLNLATASAPPCIRMRVCGGLYYLCFLMAV
jgi:hypothetical protein